MTTDVAARCNELRQIIRSTPHPDPTQGDTSMSRTDRAEERRLAAVAAGLESAQKAIHAIADNDDDRALAVLNAQSYESCVWTSAVLLGCLRSTAIAITEGDPKEASRRLHMAADSAGDDASVAQAEVIVAEAFHRLTGA